MNFQSIFFVLSIFAQFTFGYSKISTGKNLTIEENQKRLDTCGKEGLPNPPNPSKSPTWFWVSYQTLPDKTRVFTSASQISSRHFLTSPITVLTRDMTWIHNGSQFDGFCQGESEHLVEIPTDVVKRLKLTPLSCYRDRKCKNPGLTPLRAFIPLLCEMMVRILFSLNYTPMIVEVQNEILAHPVCINHRMYSIEEGDTVTSYRLYEDTTTSQSELTVTYSPTEQLLETTKIASTGNFSGPIVKLLADKWTIVGYIPSCNRFRDNCKTDYGKQTSSNCYQNNAYTGACPVPNTFTPVKTSVPMTTGRPTIPTRPATSQTVASTKSPITVAVVQKTLPPTMVHLTTATTTPTTVATVKPVITKPPEALTTVMSMKTSPPVKKTVATATVTTTTMTTEKDVTTGPFTTVTSTTSSTKPLPVSKTVATVADSTIGETTSQVTTPKVTTDSGSMTVPTILPQNSTDEITPDSSVDPSAPTNQTTHPEDPPPDDPVTYKPPLALGIDFSLGPEHSIDEPPIDYEEYEERKKHMDDDDQDYKDFWMDETGNGGEKGMRIVLLLIFVIHFMRR